MELFKQVREYSNCTILYAVSDGTAEEHISALQQLGGPCGVSTMKHRIYTPQYCKALTDKGYIVQASIFKIDVAPIVAPYMAINTLPEGLSLTEVSFRAFSVIYSGI